MGPPVTAPAITPSPCVRNCCLDENDVCMGCGRALQEIIAWSTSPESDKREILRLSRERLERREQREREQRRHGPR